MGFKNYIIATLIIIALIGGYIFTLDLGSYALIITEWQFEQVLPIYIWIIIPALVIFLSTLLHMSFYGTKAYFVRQAINKDTQNILSIVKDRLSDVKSSKTLKTTELKELGSILNQLEINIPQGEFNSNKDDVNSLVGHITNLEKEEYVPARDLKLKEDNPLMIKNNINRVKTDDNFAIEVLKGPSRYSDQTIEIAFFKILENKSITTMKDLLANLTLSDEMSKALLKKDSTSSKDLAFTNSEILEYIQNNKFSNNDLIEIARNYKRTMSPEQLIKLYEDIMAADESKTESYLYVLSEFEMITQVREIIVNSQKDEFILYKALIDLKDAGKKYTIDSLIIK
jgi:hypothetical protein